MMNGEKIMRRDVVAVRAEDPIATARRHMIAQGLTGIPVVDSEGRVIGIVTEDDFLVRCLHRRPLPWWEFMFGDSERLGRDYRKCMGTTVGEVMTPVSTTVRPDGSVQHAAILMHTKGLALLLVVAEGALMGVL